MRTDGWGWVAPYIGRYRKPLCCALLLGVCAAAFSCGLMVTAGYLVAGSAAVETVLLLNVPLMLVRLFGVGKPVLRYLERLSSHDWVLRMTSDMRRRLYRALERRGASLPSSRGQAGVGRRLGDALGLLAEDVGHLQDLYLRVVFPCVVAWVLGVLGVALLGACDVWIALALAASFFAVLVVFPLVSLLACRAREARIASAKASLYADVADDVLGAADWVYSGRGEARRARYREQTRALHALLARERRFERARDALVQVCFALCVVALTVWAAHAFGAGAGDANWIAALALGFFPLIEAFAPVPQAAVDSLKHRASLDRLAAVSPASDEASGEGAVHGEDNGSPEPAFAHPCDIVFESVSFRYPGAPSPALEGFSLVVPEGQRLAVLGRSGAGKSTLLAMMRGLAVPERGSVRIGGVDPAGAGSALADRIGVIEQSPHLFNDSLLANLRIAKEDVTAEEAEEVLRAVGLGSLLDQLPDGVDTPALEAGARFSGGERHRIALARVLLREVPIVLLDEPFAGLDPAGERALLDSLLSLLVGKTIVLVTHHLSGVERMDRVLFLERGACSMYGSPSELSQTSARYRELLALEHAGLGR